MSVLVLALTTVNPEKPDALAAYLATTQPLLEAADAEIVARYQIEESIIGDAPARMVTMVRYPDRNAVERVFESSEYKLLREIREDAFLEYQINVVSDLAR